MNWLKQAIRRVARALNYDIRRVHECPNLFDFLKSRKVNLVIDVGANTGQFARHLRKEGYSGRIISFEPISEIFEQLQTSADGDKNWTVFNIAIGAKPGQATINIAKKSEFSSLLPQAGTILSHDSEAETIRTQEIKIARLDDVVSVSENDAVFLKIDTQGFEQDVLSGAHNILAVASGVMMELPIIHLYEGVWSMEEALKYMRGNGYVPSQIHPVNYHSKDAVSLLEVDCIFRRVSELDAVCP